MNYSGINAKVRAMRSNLLKKQDYIKLSNLKTVEEVAEELKKNNNYKKIISVISQDKMHRGVIENKLTLSLMSDFERIYKFVFDYSLRKYLSAYFLRHEILILKLILSMIQDQRDIEYTMPELNSLLRGKIKTDLKKLKSSTSIKEFINNLVGTEFYNVLSNAYKETRSLFELEIKLDIYYYLHLWSLQKKYLSTQNKNIVSVVKGTEIDLTNISWLYRMKKYYNLEPNRLYSYLIPIRFRLSSNEISSLVKANTMSEFNRVLKNTFYGNEFSNDSLSIEKIFYKNMSLIYNKFFMMSNNSISSIIYYIYLKELEINNIFSLIECVRYKLPAEKILGYIYL